jgi:hypothetical protein
LITVSDEAAAVIESGTFVYDVRIDSYYDGDLVAADLPLQIGPAELGIRANRGARQRVTFDVPRELDGIVWAPDGTTRHPLAANGQRVHVQLGVGTRGGTTDFIDFFGRGWFVVMSAEASGDVVSVECEDLLTLIEEARLVVPYQPSGTLSTALRGLIEPALTVTVDAGLNDRSIPAGINWDDERLSNVQQVLDAWPAEAAVTADGYLQVVPPADPSAAAVASIVQDEGTIVSAAGSSKRQDGFSAVVARGTAADGGQVQAIAYDTTTARSYPGPWNPLVVPYFFFSPLLTTVQQCTQAANTVLARLGRESARRFKIEAVPDPRLQLGDMINVESDAYTGRATIEEQALPYRAGGSGMTLVVAAVLS